MDALMFFDPRSRVLISGDALWREGMGFVWPGEGADSAIAAALETLAAIERLDPALVIPGHGEAFPDVASALATVRSKLHAFARDPAKNARHVAKVMFVFALLDRESMPVADVPGYLAAVPCYGELARGFLGQAPEEIATWMLPDLERSKSIDIRNGVVRPLMAA